MNMSALENLRVCAHHGGVDFQWLLEMVGTLG